MSESLTFLAVHAHPDDEASSTGGSFPLLASQGVRTVLVTCTNGEHGDAAGGVKPDEAGHDPDEVAELRRGELDRACEILHIDRLVRLGYRDSGMDGWPQNDHEQSFWQTPVAEAAEKLLVVLREERPQVIMTYNDFGFYGHPDHIQAHRITMAAVAQLDYEPTVYFNAIPKSVFRQWRQRRREAGEDVPDDDDTNNFGTEDDDIAAIIDVAATNGLKFDALAAHASPIGEGSFWMQMGREKYVATNVTEWFVRATNPLGLTGVVNDLFAGYR